MKMSQINCLFFSLIDSRKTKTLRFMNQELLRFLSNDMSIHEQELGFFSTVRTSHCQDSSRKL